MAVCFILRAGLQDLIPYLVRHQQSSPKAASAVRGDSMAPAANGQHESAGSLAATESMEHISPGHPPAMTFFSSKAGWPGTKLALADDKGSIVCRF